MTRETRNTLIRLSADESLSERFRRACRVELGDFPAEVIAIRRK
jgi:hypothetical protein